MSLTLDVLRQFTVARNFPLPTTLKRALHQMNFVQADPIRSPARAQDLILRQRVNNYRAGDLERHYVKLEIEEDFFVNYGYVTYHLEALMHPRSNARVPADDVSRTWPIAQRKRAKLLLDFVKEHGEVHPRQVDDHFSHGKVTNYWGGSSNATTHLLDAMHYSGMLRIARREKGIRIYKAHEYERPVLTSAERRARIDALVDVVVDIYAPLPASSLGFYLRRLRYAVPQWQRELKNGIERAKKRLNHALVEGMLWYWPANAELSIAERFADESKQLRLLAPFDPLVHDRTRFELLWGWVYRFEAYTPAPKRKLGYYAMPLLWHDCVIGWGNLFVKNGRLDALFGYVEAEPKGRAFKRELDLELDRIRKFLQLEP